MSRDLDQCGAISCSAMYQKLCISYFTLLYKIKLIFQNSLRSGFHPKEVVDKLNIRTEIQVIQSILEKLCKQGRLTFSEGQYGVPVDSMHSSVEHKTMAGLLLEFAFASGLKPFSAGHFCKVYNNRFDKKTVGKILRHFKSQGKLILLEGGDFITPEALEEIKSRISSKIKQKGGFSIQDCPEVFGYGRSRAISVLEYLDKTGFTERRGNIRVLNRGN